MTTAAATAEAAARSDGLGERFAARRPVLRLLGAEAAAELAGKVHSAREIGRRQEERRRAAFPTGLEPLDRLLDGGLPRGRLVELVGRPGSGRFAAALGTLATATAAGQAAALVDLGDHLDPRSLTDLGADLRRLLWLRPRSTREALAAAEAVLAGGFPLLVMDLGTPPVPGGRGLEAGWVRLARAAQAGGAALLVSSPYRASGTAAHTVIAARPGRALRTEAAGPGSPPLFRGLAARLTVEKSRGRLDGDAVPLELALPTALAPPPPVSPAGGAARTAETRGDTRRRAFPGSALVHPAFVHPAAEPIPATGAGPFPPAAPAVVPGSAAGEAGAA